MLRSPNTGETCRTCGNKLATPFRAWEGSRIVLGCVDPDHDEHLVNAHAAWAKRPEARAIRKACVTLPR